MKSDIKRVNWQMGQMLLPHHLYAQEESILGHAAHTLKYSGIPHYGVVNAHWDPDLFQQGIISLSDLTLLFPSGQLIDIPGNALPTSFDLNGAGKSEVSLFLHLIDERKEKEEEVTLLDETVKIKFALDQTLLSPQKNADMSKHVFKLALFEKSQESEWRLSESYIPPLLTTTPAPFLTHIFANIERVIKSVRKKLEREMDGAEFFAAHNIEWRLCLLELSRLERFCDNALIGDVALHPYYLYERLSTVLDCAGNNGEKLPTYNHEDLAGLLGELIRKIEYLFINEQQDFSFIEFERKESNYIIDALPPALSKAKEAYIIVQKPDVETQFSANSLKLTSRQRKEFIEHFFVSGITLTRVNKPAFLSTRFAEEVEAFAIEHKEEWRKALSEGNLVLSHQDLNRDFNVFLYWRNKDGAV